ncbi:MAG: hypothetical protein KF893_02960 [Caldilineaceae bacterium]|nr:hypothetical protein [Caldilineaceae bacterium]
MLYPVLEEKASYTFSDYFNMGIHVEDMLKHFGYTFEIRDMELPSVGIRSDGVLTLQTKLNKHLPSIDLSSEISRREFLIAPVLLELIDLIQVKIRSEYPIRYNDQLKGTLDYLLQAQKVLLIIEAKRDDLVQGFTQLAAELIAYDGWTDSKEPILYGAISTGEIWRFGRLDRTIKHVTQDLSLYRVPADLHELMSILVGILTGAEPDSDQ